MTLPTAAPLSAHDDVALDVVPAAQLGEETRRLSETRGAHSDVVMIAVPPGSGVALTFWLRRQFFEDQPAQVADVAASGKEQS